MAPFKRFRPAAAATGFALVLALLLGAAPARAVGLYLPSGDGGLRSDLTLLIDAGVLDLSTMAWPLPRADLERALEDARIEEDSPLQIVLDRVRRAAVGPGSGTFSMRLVAGHSGLLRDFETAGREDGSATLAAAFGGTRWSTTLVVAGVTDPADRHALRFDGSEVTLRAGNWLLGVNALDRWWGPGQQGSLILSSNARPVPALMLDRAESVPWGFRPLSWLGPWHFTMFVGRMEGARRDIPNPLLMGMRLAFRPRPWLQLGVQRTNMLCGSGRICDARTWWDMLVGHDNTPGAHQPGDALAGFDGRVSWPGRVPVAFYTQWIGEDASQMVPFKYLGLFGLELGSVASNGATWHAFAEYSDSTCSFYRTSNDPAKPQLFNCAYNNNLYNVEGYRYYGRALGESTDNDSRLLAVGARYAPAYGGEWRVKYLHGDLNRDQTTPDIHNTVAVLATKYRALEGGWRGRLFGGEIGLQVGVQRLRALNAAAHVTGYGYLDWQRALPSSFL